MENNHLRDENIRLKILLHEIIDQYGDRPHYGEGLFTAAYQPSLIKRAMQLTNYSQKNLETPR
jgi:hypothetical protein